MEFLKTTETESIKSVDLVYKSWRNKIYGNTYSACIAVIDYGTGTQEVLCPNCYEYGNGNTVASEALKQIEKTGFNVSNAIIRKINRGYTTKKDLSWWCKQHSIYSVYED